MQGQHHADVVTGALARMDRHARTMRLALFAAAAMEGLLMVVALITLDWADRAQVSMFIFAMLGYSIIALGLVALGAHVSRVGARVVAALDSRGP